MTGKEKFTIPIHDQIEPLAEITVTAEKDSGDVLAIPLQVRLDTPVEVEYYRNGGILHTVLRNMAKDGE